MRARDDLRFSNTAGILPLKKNKKNKKLCGLLKQSKRPVYPLLKKILDPPLSRKVEAILEELK